MQQAVEREVAKFADGQARGICAVADGRVAKLPLRAAVQDLADRVSVEVRDAGEVFLIPALFLDEPRDLVREVPAWPPPMPRSSVYSLSGPGYGAHPTTL